MKNLKKVKKLLEKRYDLYEEEAIKRSEDEDCESNFYEGMKEGMSEALYLIEKYLL